MAQSYQGYEISLSRYPNDQVLYIVREANGRVIFRRPSLNKIKQAIDDKVGVGKKPRKLAIKKKSHKSKK